METTRTNAYRHSAAPSPEPKCFGCGEILHLTECNACKLMLCWECRYGKRSVFHGHYHLYGYQPHLMGLHEEIRELRFDARRWMLMSGFLMLGFVLLVLLIVFSGQYNHANPPLPPVEVHP